MRMRIRAREPVCHVDAVYHGGASGVNNLMERYLITARLNLETPATRWQNESPHRNNNIMEELCNFYKNW